MFYSRMCSIYPIANIDLFPCGLVWLLFLLCLSTRRMKQPSSDYVKSVSSLDTFNSKFKTCLLKQSYNCHLFLNLHVFTPSFLWLVIINTIRPIAQTRWAAYSYRNCATHILNWVQTWLSCYAYRDAAKRNAGRFAFRGGGLHWIHADFYAYLGYFNMNGIIWGVEPEKPLNTLARNSLSLKTELNVANRFTQRSSIGCCPALEHTYKNVR